MKSLAIIPARYGSTRFPGKPLVKIGEKPMIRHVWERTRNVVEDCYVATDDDRIFDAVQQFGGKAVMTSADHRSGTDRCWEAVCKISERCGTNFDIILNIQGDEPFINGEHITALLGIFDNPDAAIGTLVSSFTAEEDIFDENIPKVVTGAGSRALYFSRSPIPFVRGVEKSRWQECGHWLKHIGMYAYRHDALRQISGLGQGELERLESLEQLRWLENGLSIHTARVSGHSLSVDTPEDLKRLLETGIFP